MNSSNLSAVGVEPRAILQTCIARIALCLVAGVLCSAPALAQTPIPTIPADQPFTVFYSHDGLRTDGYRLYLNDIQTGPDLPPGSLVNGELTIPVAAGVPVGAHSVRVSAFNAAGETSSQPLAFEALLQPPNAPTGGRISVEVTVSVKVQVPPQ